MIYVAIAVHVALGGVFLASSIAKIANLHSAVAMVQSVPGPWHTKRRVAHIAAVTLIVIEFGVGILCLVPVTPIPRIACWVAMVMLLMFSALAVASGTGHISTLCACFGRAKAQLGWRHLWRNLVLLGLAVFASLFPLPGLNSVEIGGVIVAVAAALLIVALSLFYEDLVDVLGGPNSPHQTNVIRSGE